MSNNIDADLAARTALIEKSMKQARIERSKVVWDMLQRLFSRPESADDAIVHGAKAGFRLG